MEIESRLKNSRNHNSCVHQKNIYSIIDLSPSDEQYTFLNQHLKECSHCRQEYDHFKEKVFAAQVFIPRPAMDRELKETFEREMHELLDQLGISEKNFNKKRIVLKFSQLNKMGEEIIKILIQPRMMMSFGIAGLLFYLMKRLTKIN